MQQKPPASASTIIAVVLAGLLASGATAQIYKYKDAQGNTVFSDKHPNGGQDGEVEEVKLNAINSAQTPPKMLAPESSNKAASADVIRYETTIIQPTNNTTIAMGPGDFVITAQISPALDTDETLRLNMDGVPIGKAQRSSSWQLSSVFRGEHSLVVDRLQNSRVISSSTPVTVYVLRPSVR